jgi:hypothetical protein
MVLALLGNASQVLAQGKRGPDLSEAPQLRVPAGHKLSSHAYAVGVQIYTWNGTSWVFKQPIAVLYPNEHGQGVIGLHDAGPIWESNSGSYVRGAVLDRATVDPTAIPWLLLAATDSDGPGIFNHTTYIHRVNTVGGLAPTQPGLAIGDEARIPYTAEYFFYKQSR